MALFYLDSQGKAHRIAKYLVDGSISSLSGWSHNGGDLLLLEDFQVLKEVTAMYIENTMEAALIEALE